MTNKNLFIYLFVLVWLVILVQILMHCRAISLSVKYTAVVGYLFFKYLFIFVLLQINVV